MKSPTPLLRLRHKETGSRAHRPRPSASDCSTRPLLPPPLLAPVGLRRPPSLAPVSAAGPRRPRKASVFCSHWPRKASIPSSQALPRPPQAAPELPLGRLQLLPSSITFSLSLSLTLCRISGPEPSFRAQFSFPDGLRPVYVGPEAACMGPNHAHPWPLLSVPDSKLRPQLPSASAPLGLVRLPSPAPADSPQPQLPSALAPLSQLPLASYSSRLQLLQTPLGLSSPRPTPLGLVRVPSLAPTDSPRPQLPSASTPLGQLPSASAPLSQLHSASYGSRL